MAADTGSPPSTPFLAGGGEMGERMRAFDWSKTALGPVETWPQSLRSPLSMLLPSKAQIVFFWGPEFVVFYNDAYRPVFGAKHPQVLGQPGRIAWSEIWDTGANLHALLDGVVRTGEAFHARDLLFVIDRHGFSEETYFDVSYDPVRDESGGVGGVFCIVTETTGRVVGERRLALLRDLAERTGSARTARDACALAMQALADRADVPFALAWLGDELQACTPGAEGLLGREQAKELPIPGGKLVLGVNARRPFDEGYASFLDLAAGQVTTAITNARAYEDERRRAEALAEIDRAKTSFFTNVSHEFRTPLALMLGPLEELRQSLGSGTQRELAATAERNAERLLKLVNTLLDFARIEGGRAEARFEPTDLGAATAELASTFRAACERAGLALVVDCAASLPPVYVDRDQWEKVVLNLLSNAFKFTFEGKIVVGLGTSADGRHAELTVRDTGVGIPAGELGKLFGRFQRIEGVRGRSIEGSGIGLALVAEVVKLHGGRIEASSTEGRGTAFTVSLPFGSAHLPVARVHHAGATTPRAPTQATPFVGEALQWLPDVSTADDRVDTDFGALGIADAAPARATTGVPRILVADDNADLRAYLQRLLGAQHAVQIAADGDAALAQALQQPPDLVLADVMMPGLDGFQLIARLRADERTRTLPIILLSARAGEEARVEGLAAGADDYLVKPFSARELLARVDAHLSTAQMRRDAEQAVRASEAQFRALVTATSDIVYRMSPDWTQMRHLLGHDFIADTLEPSSNWLTTYIPEDERSRVMAVIEHAIRTKSVFELEHRVIRVDGSVGWTFSRAIPILDGSEIVEWLGAASDVTPRKEAEQALREADRRKDEFLATLAHELRNPLAPIRNALHLLTAAGGAAQTERVHQMLERQVTHLVRLVDDLMEASRISRGKLDLKRDTIALADVLRHALETSKPLIDRAHHDVDVVLPDEPLWLDGDAVRLAQVFANLLNNAAKYTEDGGRIELSARRDGNWAEVSVLDNGIGITPEQLPHLFEMFAQFDRSHARIQGGLGIGLSLAQRLVQMHGGSVQAASDGPGRGSRFTVRLPLAHASATASHEPASTSKLEARRILVVDDNRDAADSLGMLLRFLGAEVLVEHDGAAALSTAETWRPAVILLDLGMPGVNGFEVARRLRADRRFDGLKLVALTGWGQEEDRRRTASEGFDHHLIKPVDLNVLQALLVSMQERRAQVPPS